MKLYNQKALFSTILLSMALFASSASFGGSKNPNNSDVENPTKSSDSRSERVWAGLKQGAETGAKTSAILAGTLSSVIAILKLLTLEEITPENIGKITGTAIRQTLITALVNTAIGGSMGALIGWIENNVKTIEKKTKKAVNWGIGGSVTAGMANYYIDNSYNFAVKIGGQIAGAMIGYLKA